MMPPLHVALAPGSLLGAYRIVGPLGAGGMGEVYRASDTKLGRDVALKILPPGFASDPERRARFAREARTLASLNHPNIAHIYGLEEDALVMELVEGEDLALRLARGAMPLGDVLPIARQIADALECAHEAGIIHRDLKPANIKIRDDGTVKVLDFGLAKALSSDGGGAPADDASNSPTLTSLGTQLGMILGTAAYMAPEQAKGKMVDRRADVWAFGVVLYEMLTGRRLFEGEDVSDTLAAVLTRDPNWHDLPASTPPSIRRLLARCLARDRRARLDSMAGARLEVEEALANPAGEAQVAAARAEAALLGRTRPSVLVLAGIAVAASSLGWFLSSWMRGGAAGGSGAALRTPIVSSLLAPPDAISAFHRGFALSPDGETLVVSARSADGARALWRRRLAEETFERIAGTEGGVYPFWSSDSRDIGFFAAGAMKRASMSGGPTQTITSAPGVFPRASWNDDGEILFSLAGTGPSAGIFRVAATGGTPTRLSIEGAVSNPEWIRGARAFLFMRAEPGATRLWVGTSDGAAEPRALVDLEPRDPGFLLSPSGVVIFNYAGVLNGQRLDERTLALTGPAQPISTAAGTPRAWFGASASGDSLLVLAGPTAVTGGNPGDPLSRLRWVDRQGRAVGDVGGAGRYWTHRLSPDGRRVVVNPDKDLWILDAGTSMRSRWTTGPATYSSAIWNTDGTHLLYREAASLVLRPVDGDGAPVEILAMPERTFIPTDWSVDGTVVMTARETSQAKSTDLFLLKRGERAATPFAATEYNERQARFSPNGRWVAFASDLTGRQEVYLRPVTGDAAALRVSSDGGEHPQFRRDGLELFYLTPTDEVVAVDLTRFEATGAPGASRALFRLVMNDIIRETYSPFDVSPDGRRFLVNVPEPSEPLTLIQRFQSLVAGR